MKKLITTLVSASLLALTHSIQAQETNKNAEFTNAQKIYQEQLTKIEEAYATKPKTILAEYAKELDALEQAMTKHGNLQGVLAVRREKADFKVANSITGVTAQTPTELKALKEKYTGMIAAIEPDKKKELERLSSLYIGRLEKLQVSLTKAAKIDDALEVNNEIDKIKGSVHATTLPEPPQPPQVATQPVDDKSTGNKVSKPSDKWVGKWETDHGRVFDVLSDNTADTKWGGPHKGEWKQDGDKLVITWDHGCIFYVTKKNEQFLLDALDTRNNTHLYKTVKLIDTLSEDVKRKITTLPMKGENVDGTGAHGASLLEAPSVELVSSTEFDSKFGRKFPSNGNRAAKGVAEASSSDQQTVPGSVFSKKRIGLSWCLTKVTDGWFHAKWEKPVNGQYILLFARADTAPGADNWGDATIQVNDGEPVSLSGMTGQTVAIVDLHNKTVIKEFKIEFKKTRYRPGMAGLEVH